MYCNSYLKLVISVLLLLILPNFSWAQVPTNYEYTVKAAARVVIRGNYSGWRYVALLDDVDTFKTEYIPNYGSFNSSKFVGWDSVPVFYYDTVRHTVNIFDTKKLKVKSMHFEEKGNVGIVIKEIMSGKEMVVLFDYTIVIDGNYYEMPKTVINFLGKYLPTPLRDNWEIHYDYLNNRFYIGPFISPLEKTGTQILQDLYDSFE